MLSCDEISNKITTNSAMETFHRHLKKTSSTTYWKSRFCIAIHYLLFFGLWFFAILPFSKWPYVNELYKLCWVIEIFAVIFHVFFKFSTARSDAEYSVGGLVSSMVFIAQVSAHLTIQWDVWCKHDKRKLLYQKIENLDYSLIKSKLEVPIDVNECNWKRCLLMISILLQLAFWHTLISWTTFRVHTTATSLYWHGLLSGMALQFRMLEFLLCIVFLNSRLANLHCNINVIGERNLKLTFYASIKSQRNAKNGRFVLVSPFHGEEEDARQLDIMKSLHNEIFSVFQIVNDCYGCSLLAFTALYFVDFVTNSYWVVLSMITQGRDNLAFLQNGGFLWIVVVMLSMVCWHCQKSYDYSRQIGCLIFKLVKPLGNKRYNDLVNEFSLQTMHQQFVITAKEFFSLNLNLLGSMVAAIVTYLVILIQFMFTEKSNLERAMTAENPLNVTTTMAAFPAINSTHMYTVK